MANACAMHVAKRHVLRSSSAYLAEAGVPPGVVNGLLEFMEKKYIAVEW